MEILTEYSLIGEDEDEDGEKDLRSAEPGSVWPIRQALFELVDDITWDHGEGRVGTLHGVAIVVRRGHVVCHLVFEFDEDHALVASGALPAGESHMGDGVIAVTGGTGGFAKASGVCLVKARNPKRWDIFI